MTRGRDGYFRCPHRCGDPNYGQPKWKTEEGFAGHLAKCKARPDVLPMPSPPPLQPRQKHSDCPDCGNPIMEMESVWWMRDRVVCIACHSPYLLLGRGHHEAAGIDLPGLFIVA